MFDEKWGVLTLVENVSILWGITFAALVTLYICGVQLITISHIQMAGLIGIVDMVAVVVLKELLPQTT